MTLTPTTNDGGGSGESCNECSLCCKLLEIQPEPDIQFKFKPYNTWCQHCKPGRMPGGCQIYEHRPQACSSFKCLWLQSQERQDVPSMSPTLKPSKSHCVFIESDDAFNVSFVFVDPSYPNAYKQEPVRSLLIDVTNKDRTVIVVIGRDRYLMTKGRPTIKLSEGQLHDLVTQQQQQQQVAAIKTGPEGKMQIGYPSPQQLEQHLLSTTRASVDPSLVPRRQLRDDYDR